MTSQDWPSWLPLRGNLRELSAYGAPQLPADAVLNTNENPYAPSPELAKAIAAKVLVVAATLNRYPDRDAISLRSKLAEFVNGLSGTSMKSGNIWAANGSNEIIQSLFLAFGGGSAIGFTPSYSMHPLIARVCQVAWTNGSRRADYSLDIDSAVAQIQSSKPSLTFITTPNNPTGSAVTLDEIEKLAINTPGLLVVDRGHPPLGQRAGRRKHHVHPLMLDLAMGIQALILFQGQFHAAYASAPLKVNFKR